MKNIFVVGISGSGKSTLGKYLAKKLDYRYLELDAIFWLPNWTKRNAAELKRMIELEQSKAGGLVLDGNTLTKGAIISPGDVLIFLDYSRALIVSRVLRRSIKRVIFRTELWSGNKERAKFLFSRDPEINPVLWAYKTHQRRQAEYLSLIQSLDGVTVHQIRTKNDLRLLRERY